MKIVEEDGKRGVGSTIRLWPKINGAVHIPYVIDSSSKFEGGKGRFTLNDYMYSTVILRVRDG